MFVWIYFSFPEMFFFKDESVRDVMTNVLFCFARVHAQVAYKQVDFISWFIPFCLFVLYSVVSKGVPYVKVGIVLWLHFLWLPQKVFLVSLFYYFKFFNSFSLCCVPRVVLF